MFTLPHYPVVSQIQVVVLLVSCRNSDPQKIRRSTVDFRESDDLETEDLQQFVDVSISKDSS